MPLLNPSHPPPPSAPSKPPLFIRSLVPNTAIHRSLVCSLLPASPAHHHLVLATHTHLYLHTLHTATSSLAPLTHLVLFNNIYDIAAVPSPLPATDVLIVLTDNANISFFQYDPVHAVLRPSGHLTLHPTPLFPHPHTIRTQPRLLATHAQKRLVAVAAMESRISVFPLLFFKHITAGKIASVNVDGLILAIHFLEDDHPPAADTILVALLQKGPQQVVALYTVAAPHTAAPLTLTFVASIITCPASPDHQPVSVSVPVPVPRAPSKIPPMPPPLTAQNLAHVPPAVSITRLNGCPFLFAVFLRGRVIVADARPVVIAARPSPSSSHPSLPDRHSPTLPSSVALNQSRVSGILSPDPRSTRSPQQRIVDAIPDDDDDDDDVDDDDDDDDDMDLNPDFPPTASSSGVLTPSSSGPDFVDGFVTPTQTPTNVALGEPPAVTTHTSRRPRRAVRDIPPLHNMSRRTTSSRSLYTGQEERGGGMADDNLSYLFVPPYITLNVGQDNGFPTACVDATPHFSGRNPTGSGLYFTMESGAMFILRWSETVADGLPTYTIPGSERTRTAPKKNFWVEYVGDVGPAITLAALDTRLLYVANDAADASLRRVHLPRAPTRRREASRYGLEVRQEFLNLAPISDFIIVPPSSESQPIHNNHRPKNKPLRRPPTPGAASYSTPSSSSSPPPPPPPPLEAALREEYLLATLANQEKQQSAFDHVLYGAKDESEMVVCSGIGRHGSVRLIRPGAPVTVFASSDKVFTACNDMWPMRFARSALHDAGIVLSFAQSTVLLLSAPALSDRNRHNDDDDDDDDDGDDDDDDAPAPIARLVNGTSALGIIPNRRTICIGVVQDGVVAQVHEDGIRVICLQKAGNTPWQYYIQDGILNHSLINTMFDWTPPEAGIISMGTIGAGLILISLVRGGGEKPKLFLLQCYPGESCPGLCILSSAELEHEVSCMEIPDWESPPGWPPTTLPNVPPMAVVGTYAPAIEIWLLGPSMGMIVRKMTYPWFLSVPEPRHGESTRYGPESSRDFAESHRARVKSTPRRPRGVSLRTAGRAKHEQMTAVPESICALTIDDRRRIFVGLRDGSVLCTSFGDILKAEHTGRRSRDDEDYLSVDSHRKLGHRPITLKPIIASIGVVVLAQAERPWMCTSRGAGKFRWTPLCFTETSALCSFSVPGAERCFATVSEDKALYICGLRRKSEVSVRSFHVGATPRRVLKVASAPDCIVVATSTELGFVRQTAIGNSMLGGLPGPAFSSELRAFSHTTRRQSATVTLLPGELVHTLVEWLGFIVVGTSWAIHDSNPRARRTRGRLLLYYLRSSGPGGAGASSAAASSTGYLRFALCSEVVLPGAVLAGVAHPTANIFVASCNEQVLVFAVPKSGAALVEIGRVSARTMVVSLSVSEDIICVVDRKDSVTFFQLHAKSKRLERDRSDHRRRVVSDAIQTDRGTAVAVDRMGAFFTIGYEEGDVPAEEAILRADGSVISPVLRNMYGAGMQQMSGMDMGIEQDGVMTEGEQAKDSEENGGEGSELGEGDLAEREYAEGELERRRKAIPRNLICHHSFNMNDTALRVRIGSFCRSEKRAEIEDWDKDVGTSSTVPSEMIFCRGSGAAICGTLGGAIVTGVAMTKEVYGLLSELESELGEVVDSCGGGFGSNHRRFRSIFGSPAKCCVDGDLLRGFGDLSMRAKREILSRTSYAGEVDVVGVEGIINELVDRVG